MIIMMNQFQVKIILIIIFYFISPLMIYAKDQFYLVFAYLIYPTAKKKIMHLLQQPISREELRSLAGNTFGDMIKCVADVSMGILALDAELHADLESLLLENGSAQENLWGFNLYPNEEGEDFIEYDSLIIIRSWQGNPSRGISNPETREAIEKIVAHFIIR